MATLPNEISSLSVDEKFDLLDAIWEDLEAQPTLSAEQLDRRIAAYEANPKIGTPWEQVKAGCPGGESAGHLVGRSEVGAYYERAEIAPLLTHDRRRVMDGALGTRRKHLAD